MECWRSNAAAWQSKHNILRDVISNPAAVPPIYLHIYVLTMAFAARNVASQRENVVDAPKDAKAAAVKAGQSLLQQGSKRRCGTVVNRWSFGPENRHAES
jgi:hypothetical protein